MKCSYCGKKAVVNLRYAGKKFCEKHFIDFYERKVRRVIKKNNMFSRKEKIGVGVSGGKDSLVMLYLLKKMHYDVTAIAIDEGIKGYRDKTLPYVKKLCAELDVPLHLYSFKQEYGMTLDQIHSKKKTLACSYCGVLRRSLLNKAARELRCDKLAIGHNLDDEVQMIIMNLTRSELLRLARSGPVVGLVKHGKFVPRAKPLRECSEKEDVIYALLKGIEYSEAECPYAHEAFRSTVREAINLMEEKHPGVKIGILRSFDRMLPFLRKYFSKTSASELNECVECGELTSGKLCKACELMKNL